MHPSPNRLVATIFGAGYLVAGIVGLFVSIGVGFFATSGSLLLGLFAINGFLNVIHIVIGAALLLAALSNVHAAKTANPIAGTACLVLGLVGLFTIGTGSNILALNGADDVLHFAAAVVLLAVGLGAERSVAPAATA